MPACGGDLQGTFHVLLAHHILKVRQRSGIRLRDPGGSGGERGLPPEVGRQGGYVRHAVYRHPISQGGLGGVFRRDEELADACVPGGQGHGQHAGDAPQRPGEGQLAQEGGVARRRRHFPRGGQQPHENGQVVHRAGLFLPRRRQVDGDAADRELGSAVLHCRPHPLPGFPHGCVRQAHHVKGREPAGEEALHADLISCDPIQAQGADRDYHGTSLHPIDMSECITNPEQLEHPWREKMEREIGHLAL